jgi:peptide/nickel transport system substrate-binding protein
LRKRISHFRMLCVSIVLAAGALATVAATSNAARSRTASASHTFVDLVASAPAVLDETQTPITSSTTLLPSWASPLVRQKSGTPGPGATLPNAVTPYLAKSWTRESNGDYTFMLRKDVYGSTGDHFTAADVVWSFQRMIHKSLAAPVLLAEGNINKKDPVTVINPYEVRINVTAPSALTLDALAWFDLGIYDSKLMKAHATKKDPWAVSWGDSHSATYAAYYVSGFVPSQRITLTQNPHFFGPKPYYSTVVIQAVSNSTTALEEVLSGQADHTTDIPWQEFASAVKTGKSKGVTASILGYGSNVESLYLVEKYKPLANVLVRRAINMAINRDQLLKIYAGYAQADSETAPPLLGQKQHPVYDPTEAKKLLAQAGYPHGFPLQIISDAAVADASIDDVLAVIKSDLAAVGITVSVNTSLGETELYAKLGSLQDQANVADSGGELPTRGSVLEGAYNSILDPFGNPAYTGYKATVETKLLQEALKLPAGRAYDALLTKANAHLDEEVPIVNLLVPGQQNITRSNITGYGVYTYQTVFYEYLHPAG